MRNQNYSDMSTIVERSAQTYAETHANNSLQDGIGKSKRFESISSTTIITATFSIVLLHGQAQFFCFVFVF